MYQAARRGGHANYAASPRLAVATREVERLKWNLQCLRGGWRAGVASWAVRHGGTVEQVGEGTEV